MKKWLFLILIMIFANQSNTFADNSLQSKCFVDLKENMDEMFYDKSSLEQISKMNYDDLEKGFSKYYKNSSSFGIDLDEAIFETRIYSYGKQTAYIHPPYSPFPTYKNSEKWENPAKDNIIIEEYIINDKGERKFLSCGYIKINGSDLMKIKSEDYFYDGDIISILKTSKDYKAWYNDNQSYNYNKEFFASWKRLFIYPKETQNDYFDKYSVVDFFPGKKVDSFKKFSEEKKLPKGEGDMLMNFDSRIYVTNENGQITSGITPFEELMPVKKEGLDKIFSLNTYYQSIQDKFPELGKKIAIRGVIHYDIMKDIMTEKDQNKYIDIWNNIFDGRELVNYAKSKEILKKSDEEYEKDFNIRQNNKQISQGTPNAKYYSDYLTKIDKVESEIILKKNEEKQIIEKENAENNKKVEIKKLSETSKSNKNSIILLLSLLVITLGVFLIYKRKK